LEYGKVCDILGFIYDNFDELISVEYLSSDYWELFENTLVLSALVSADWATLTDEGKKQVDIAWHILCETRDIDPAIMYDSVVDFFKAQSEDADIIPISQGIGND
jgi:hypothetical protein